MFLHIQKPVIHFLMIASILSCTASKPVSKAMVAPSPIIVKDTGFAMKSPDESFFENLFNKYPGEFADIQTHTKDWNVQIIYTQINRGNNGYPQLKNFYYHKEGEGYFYPASTVKLPIALLALQKLNELKNKGIDKNSSMVTLSAYKGQTEVYNDPTTEDGRPTIAQYIKKIFLVSDNDAFNRLYEFLGQDYINSNLHKKGFESAQILHRLNISLSEDENRHTNPVNFYDTSGTLLYSQPMQFNTRQYAPRKDFLGNEYYSNGQLVNSPMNFSKKNRLDLADLHKILTGLVFPMAVPASQRFNISDSDRAFVLKYMSMYPGESLSPAYDSSYNDAYVKFLFFGGEQAKVPGNIRIFNKPGDAYGQLIDVAYVVDFKNNIEFMVSAAIYCNSDGILNDDKYDYDTIGLPFMKNIGRALYDYELTRKRQIAPDLNSVKFNYYK